MVILGIIQGPTDQSPGYTEAVIVGTSEKAVDEDTGNIFENGSCIHNRIESSPWWAVGRGIV